MEPAMRRSGSSRMREKEELLQGRLPQLVGSEMKTFSLPKPMDDDGSDISLKDWQLGLRSSEPPAVYPFKPSKGSTRARFTPVQPWLDELIISPPEKSETAPTLGTSKTQCASVSPTGLDSSGRGDSTLEELEISNRDGHIEVSDIALPGITFNEVSSNGPKLDNFSDCARADRGSSLRVSFVDDLISRSPSPPRVGYRSLSTLKTHAETTFSSKTLLLEHGVRPREEKDSALPLPEIEIAHRSHGMSASRDKGSELRHSNQLRRRAGGSLDSIEESTKYDSESDFISSSSASSHQSQRENTSNLDSNSPSFLLRCNARRRYDECDKENEEDVKVGASCAGGLFDTNISADLVRLVGKLCRLSVPLPELSASKSAQQRGHRKSNSIPGLTSWDSMQSNSSMPCEDFPIMGRKNSLKLLCERCSNGPIPAYDLPKPRKIRDPEPYQHFYKLISKTLDQKLRS